MPVVGTEVDGFSDTLAERRGIIVSSEDPEALARALEDVLSGRRRPDIAAVRVWARQFDAERVATVYQQGYDERCRAVAR